MKRTVRNLKQGEEKNHLEMLNLCFNQWGNEERWKRLYHEPDFDITKNVIVVEEDGKWVGGVTAWFRKAFLKSGKKIEVYMAGDGYSVPAYRGKGVYSTFMKSMSKIAQKRGVALGFGFINVYNVPFAALPRYGFVDVFYPITKILVLNPEKFIDYVVKSIQNISFPRNFEGVKLKLIVSMTALQRKTTVSKEFQIVKGKLYELVENPAERESVDFVVETDITTLLNLSFYSAKYLYTKEKTLFFVLLIALLRRRLKLRFSSVFLKAILKLK